jgi:HEPN domain-containing protein
MRRRTAEWVEKAEEDWRSASVLAVLKPPPRDVVCFHCQQTAEKYLKALLQDLGVAVPRTHDLADLVDLLLPHDATLLSIRRSAASLTKYAVEHRYPRKQAITRQMNAALRNAERVRKAMRSRLGLEA